MCRLFTAAPKHERIATLEAANSSTIQRKPHEKIVDFILIERLRSFAFPDVDSLRCARQCQHVVAHEPVIDHDFRGSQNLSAANGQQTGIAWTGTHQVDKTGREYPIRAQCQLRLKRDRPPPDRCQKQNSAYRLP